jgi:cytochrome bd-type quinol oxidase subunit 2
MLIYPLLVYLFVRWVEDGASERSRKVLYVALVATVTWSVLLHVTAMVTWPMPPNSTFFLFPALEIPAFLLFQGAFAPNVLAWIGVPAVMAASIVILLGLAVIMVTGGMRALPYVLIVSMLFTIAIARAVPPQGSDRTRAFEVFLRYMGS